MTDTTRLAAGNIVGEVAFFAGATRSCDVKGVAGGNLAFIMMPNLQDLFEKAPATAVKLVRAFGSSAVSQIAHNPAEHAHRSDGRGQEGAW